MMMRQICFYVGSAWMLISQFMFMYTSFPKTDFQVSDNEFERALVTLAVSSDSKDRKAPWLTNPEKVPRVFVLESTTAPVDTTKYGVELSPDPSDANATSVLSAEICGHRGGSPPSATSCTDSLEVTKCTTCASTDGAWYSVVSATGSAVGRAGIDSGIHVSTTADPFRQIDIVVSRLDAELPDYTSRVSAMVKRFSQNYFNGHRNSEMRIRVITPDKNVEDALFTKVCTADDCLVIAVDSEIEISTRFLYNAMTFTQSGSSVYFPITQSSDGSWRPHDYGTFAMSGKDAHLLDGTDGDEIFQHVLEQRHIVRLEDGGVVSTRATTFKKAQISKSMSSASITQTTSSSKDVLQKTSQLKTDVLPSWSSESGQLLKFSRSKSSRSRGILIAVTTSREKIVKHAQYIMATWGKELPSHIMLRFFIGASSEKRVSSDTEMESLASKAGINASMIVVTETADDTAAPVQKTGAILKEADKMVAASRTSTNPIDWIYMVEDDTYVNIELLSGKLARRDSSRKAFIGRGGSVEGLAKPYCLGGPGYVFSRTTLREVAPTFDTCMADVRQSEHVWTKQVWQSDIMVGLCTFLYTDIGCENDEKAFVQITSKADFTEVQRSSIVNEAIVISAHPIEKVQEMIALHDSVRAGRFNRSQAVVSLRKMQSRQLSASPEIPERLLLAAKKDPEFTDRVHKINRWRNLGQAKIADRLTRKALRRLDERPDLTI